MPAANVLIVEDDFDSAEALLLLLEQAGYAAQVALTAAEALNIVDEGFCPEFAIVDIGLPEVDGLQLATLFRAKPELEHCRMIAVSGYLREGLAKRTQAAGFSTFLAKPILLEQLLAALAIEIDQAAHG